MILPSSGGHVWAEQPKPNQLIPKHFETCMRP